MSALVGGLNRLLVATYHTRVLDATCLQRRCLGGVPGRAQGMCAQVRDGGRVLTVPSAADYDTQATHGYMEKYRRTMDGVTGVHDLLYPGNVLLFEHPPDGEEVHAAAAGLHAPRRLVTSRNLLR